MSEIIVGAAVKAVVGFAAGGLLSIFGDGKRSTPAPVAPTVTPAPAPPNPLDVTADEGGPCIGIFGTMRVGGRVIFSYKRGPKTYVVMAIASAPLSLVRDVYINGQLVARNASGDVLTAPWYDTVAAASYVNVRLMDGTQVTADATLMSLLPAYTSAFIGYKTAYAVIVTDNTTAAAQSAFNGAMPTFTFHVRGHACYDPRNPAHVIGTPSTWTHSDNATIIDANYLIHELGAALPTSAVDWTSVATAANADDGTSATLAGLSEPRYRCAVMWTTAERHEDVRSRIGASHAGGMYLRGDKWVARTGVYDAPLVSLTPSEYAAGGDLTFADTDSLSETFNGVRGRFRSPVHGYEMRDIPPYQDATALSEDNGAPSWLDVDLSCVTSPSQAQRLARIAYLKSRLGARVSLSLQARWLQLTADDTLLLTDSVAGMTATPLRIETAEVAEDYSVQLQMREEPASVFAWSAGANEVDFTAFDPPGGEAYLTPPGYTLYDNNAVAGTVAPAYKLMPSVAGGWDVYQYSYTSLSGPWTDVARATTDITGQPAVSSPNNIVAAYMRVKDTSTGNTSQVAYLGTVSRTSVDALNATNSPAVLPLTPATPVLKYSARGTAVIGIKAPVGDTRSTNLVLHSVATNDVASALGSASNAVQTLSFASQNVTVTGTPGTVAYYWVSGYSSTNSKYSFTSGVLAVYF